MTFARFFPPLRLASALALVVLLAGCTIAKPRTDDPWEKFNRKTFAFNQKLDKAFIRPAAMGYRKVTTPNMRRVVNNFFTNLRLPVTMVNDLLQGNAKGFVQATGRFSVNLTLGFLGLFDPASQFGIPLHEQDFGTTLAKWGLPDGPYLVLPFFGPTTTRDMFRVPVDYSFDPLSWYGAHNDLRFDAQRFPTWFWLITMRSRGIDAESLLEGAYDPYVFYRDAYRQERIYQVYDGDPPMEVIQLFQGLDENFDPESILDEQHKYEESQKKKDGGGG